MLTTGTFKALDPAERDVLSEWLARSDRIEAVIDFSPRAWNVVQAGNILGVFEEGKQQASWLIVQHESRWTLARCDDGLVSEACDTLAEALELIDRPPLP